MDEMEPGAISGGTIEPMRRKRRGGSARDRQVEIDLRAITTRIEASAVGASVELTESNPGTRFDDLYKKLCDHRLMRSPTKRHAGDILIRTLISNNGPYFVDEDGILRKREMSDVTRDSKRLLKKGNSESELARLFPKEQLDVFLEKRVIGKVSGKLFWFVPVRHEEPQFNGVDPNSGRPKFWKKTETSYRQDAALEPEEIAFFNALPELIQRNILARAPTRGNFASTPIIKA